MDTLVLGIGNTLLSDEGIGIHVLDYLRSQDADSGKVTYLDGGTLSFTLAGAIEDADNLIVIDAAQLRKRPGAVECLVNEKMDDFLGNTKRSVHEVGLLDLFDIARLTDTLPERRALVGIQPGKIDWGDKPTDEVAAAIPVAAEIITELLSEWEGEADD